MINNFDEYLTLENIFLLSNWGVIPFWLLLLFSPNSTLTRFLVHSVIIPLILGIAYIFVVYQIYLNDNFLDGFGLYLGIEYLYAIFSDENFLLIFWLHFLCGCMDRERFNEIFDSKIFDCFVINNNLFYWPTWNICILGD